MTSDTLCVADLTWLPWGADSPVLDGVQLQLEPGERVLLAGISGAGKSTLLRACAGLLGDHTLGELAGEVSLGGTPVVPGDGRMGFVAQQPFDSIVAETVGRDVAFGPENLGLPVSEIRQRVSQVLDLVGFPYGPDHPTGALSGGQAQRLALAGVLAMRPRWLLLDEPCAMLDAPSAQRLRAATAQLLNSTGAGLIVADHDLTSWQGIVTRLVVLDRGRIVADGPMETVVKREGEALQARGLWVPGAPEPEANAVSLPRMTNRPRVALEISGLTVDRVVPLSIGLRSRLPRRVLSDVNLRICPGEVVALRGESGAGKTTLIAAALGLVPRREGEVVVGESDPGRLTSPQLAARAGWVPQFAGGLASGNTVLAALTATPQALGWPAEQAEAAARRLLDVFGLATLATRHPLSLSGGEQRRLAVASAVLHGPALVVADEPTIGLDRHAWAAVAGVLLGAREAGAGILVATHDQALVRLTDREHHLRSPGSGSAAERVPRPGLAGQAGPLSMLLAAAILTGSGLLAHGLLPLGIGLSTLALVGAVLFGFRFPLRRLVPPLVAMASIAWSNWLLADPRAVTPAVEAALKVGFIVLPGVAVASCLEPTTLGDHLGARLRLPARPVLALVAALRRLDDLAGLWQEVSQVRRVRGLGPGRSPLARGREWATRCFALLVEAIRQAGRLTVAMDGRGYSAPGPRTWLEEAPWRWADWIVVLVATALAAVPHVFGYGGM
ncbi:MAG: ATP-binding cassette domain-containing protein [Propionibacteriaceae bacterium]|nr:ATP-binding cassette domain-containing protein [Propionibacteriaceae bacterium]